MVRRPIQRDGEGVLDVRAVAVWVIVAELVAETAWTTCSWLIPAEWFEAITAATAGWAARPFVGNVPSLVILTAIVCGLGGLRLGDLGVTRRRTLVAIAMLPVTWLAIQVALLVVVAIGGGAITIDPAWHPPRAALGPLANQLFGNALVEELVFRGFLMVQLVRLAQRRTSTRRGWILGVLAAQTIFAIMHLPQRWLVPDAVFGQQHGLELVGNLVVTGLEGLVFVAVFVRTDNLMLAVVAHALWNAPTPIVSCGFVTLHVVASAVIVGLTAIAPRTASRLAA